MFTENSCNNIANEQTTQNQELRLLNLKDVLLRTKLSKSTIYQLIKDNAFPKPIKITTRRVAWLTHEVDCWVSARSNARL
jgi:prophage regulatory protein